MENDELKDVAEKLALCRDCLDVANKNVAERDRRIAELEAKPAIQYLNTNAHLETVVAEQSALIEKCETVLKTCGDDEWTGAAAREALTAIAEHKDHSRRNIIC